MLLSFKAILQYKDKRISLSTDVIEGMKSIKYLSWEGVFESKIMAIRRREFI
jgi:ATP-binding cassette subfamily C (CFTR/MRP) protein 1